MHYHGYTRLNWFSDVAFLVRDHAAEIDWERLIETVQAEQAQVPVYYSLSFLGALLDVHAPADALDRLRPGRFRRRAHEGYLPAEQVLSLQPMWRPDLSFYFTPVLKRLLPDLLVMGRRAEKLGLLLRLLLPPRAWLVHYYGLEAKEHVWVHYLLHPLKLVVHFLGEVVETLTQRKRRGGGDSRNSLAPL